MKRRDSRRSARLWPRKDEHYDKPNHTVVLVCAVQTSAPALINQHCQRCHESIPRTTGDSLEINICLTSDARLRDERKNTAECHRSARTTAESQLVQHLHEQIYTTEPACKRLLHCSCVPSFTCKCKQMWGESSLPSDQEELHPHWQENPHTYAADFMDSVNTNKNTPTLIQMQETTTMFQAAHEFNDIGRTSDSCWFSPSIRDFPLHHHICIQLQNNKKKKDQENYSCSVNYFLRLQWKSKLVHVETLSTFTANLQTGKSDSVIRVHSSKPAVPWTESRVIFSTQVVFY